ncbi:MAG TPA: TlpA disulfide reductase family protein [Opitutaceae bacterium]
MVNARSLLLWLPRCAAFAAVAACLPAQTLPGSAFPSLSAFGLTGGALPATAGKVVIVDFWASWCAPCKASFPEYSRLQAAYAARGLVVVAVSVDESAGPYDAFLAKMKPAFATALDAKHALVSVVQVPTMPTSYLLDRTGKVRFMHAGFHGDRSVAELTREIEALLAEPAPPP